MKALIKALMSRLAPQATTRFFSARARAYNQRYLAGLGIPELNRRLSDRLGNRVVRGPFTGLRLPPGAWQEQLGPYLLGTFEQELHPWIEWAVASAPARVIDVGSKFGYYVGGFALRLPKAEVIGYDTDPWAREQTQATVDLNGVSGRVQVRGFCSPARLRAAVTPRTLVISDCEGYESALFPPGCGKAFAAATLLIEIHEVLAPGVTEQLSRAFGETHQTERIGPTPRSYDGPALDFLRREEVAQVVSEIRGEQEWVLFTPNRS